MTPIAIAGLIAEFALKFGIPSALKIGAFFRASHTMTIEQAIDGLSGVLLDIQSLTVDQAIADAEKAAPVGTVSGVVTGTVTGVVK